MDVDISDILAEAGRPDASASSFSGDDAAASYTDHILLTRAWTSERCTPVLLPWPSALIERVMQRVGAQIARIEDLASGISDGMAGPYYGSNTTTTNLTTAATKPLHPPSNQNLNLTLSILQTDLSRTQFLIRSLLRQRLAKISKFAQFYLQQVDRNGEGDDSSTGESLLSPAEGRFLRHHQTLLLGFYDSTFMASFPQNLRRLDDSSGGVGMVEGPDVDAVVVVRCLVDEWSNEAEVGRGRGGDYDDNYNNSNDDDDDRPLTELRMNHGDIMIARWRDVSQAVGQGQVELL